MVKTFTVIVAQALHARRHRTALSIVGGHRMRKMDKGIWNLLITNWGIFKYIVLKANSGRKRVHLIFLIFHISRRARKTLLISALQHNANQPTHTTIPPREDPVFLIILLTLILVWNKGRLAWQRSSIGSNKFSSAQMCTSPPTQNRRGLVESRIWFLKNQLYYHSRSVSFWGPGSAKKCRGSRTLYSIDYPIGWSKFCNFAFFAHIFLCDEASSYRPSADSPGTPQNTAKT